MLKIDKTLVDYILVNQEDQRIVKAMIELGHNLGMKIVVAGGGDESVLSEYNRKINSENLNSHIQFIGNVKEPASFWKNIDVALITSRNEGTPVALIEAMLTGIPFVASNVGGIPDMTVGEPIREGNLIIHRNCILVDSFRAKDFAAALELYAQNSEERMRAGEEGEVFARDTFSIDRLVSDIERVYTDLYRN